MFLTGISSSLLLLPLSICNHTMISSKPRITSHMSHLHDSDASLEVAREVAAPSLRCSVLGSERDCNRSIGPSPFPDILPLSACSAAAVATGGGEGGGRVLQNRRGGGSSDIQHGVAFAIEYGRGHRGITSFHPLVQQMMDQRMIAHVQWSSVLLNRKSRAACDVWRVEWKDLCSVSAAVARAALAVPAIPARKNGWRCQCWMRQK